jgi:hypothetical protein
MELSGAAAGTSGSPADRVPARGTPAGVPSQVFAFATCGVAFGAVALALGSQADVAAASTTQGFVGLGLLVIATGIALGRVLGTHRIFTRYSGLGAGFVLFLSGSVLWVVVELETPSSSPPYWPVPVLLLTLVGLDWHRAERLRAVVVASGLLLVPAIHFGAATAVLVALGWFLVAVTAFWSFEQDFRAAAPRLIPPQPRLAAHKADRRGVDLVRIADVAVAVAVGLALLIGNPSCSGPSLLPSLRSGDEQDPNLADRLAGNGAVGSDATIPGGHALAGGALASAPVVGRAILRSSRARGRSPRAGSSPIGDDPRLQPCAEPVRPGGSPDRGCGRGRLIGPVQPRRSLR